MITIEDTYDDEQLLALFFRWFPVAELATFPLYPAFLRTALCDLPTTMQHVVNITPKEG